MENKNLLKNQTNTQNTRKIFPHKNLNIAIGVASVIIIVAIVGLSVWANI